MSMKAIPTLINVLTPFPHTVDSQAGIDVAKSLMDANQIRHLVVTKDKDILSVLSERDLQHHPLLFGSDQNPELTVGDVCSESIIVADVHDPLDKVLDVMVEQHLGCIVVLKEGELAGIFTTTDVCHHFSSFLKSQSSGSDIPDIIA